MYTYKYIDTYIYICKDMLTHCLHYYVASFNYGNSGAGNISLTC